MKANLVLVYSEYSTKHVYNNKILQKQKLKYCKYTKNDNKAILSQM